MENKDKTAFPLSDNAFSNEYMGLTKREYFAGLAMQGILSNEYITKIMEGDKYNPTADTAKMTILFADELLTQLNTTNGKI